MENYFFECRPVGGQRGFHRDPNTIAAQRVARFFSNTCQKMRGGKHVKVKKRRRQNILRFCADARKLILGSIGTTFDHLSVKTRRIFIIYLIELGKPNDISKKFEFQLFFTPLSITMKSQKWKITPLHILFYYS